MIRIIKNVMILVIPVMKKGMKVYIIALHVKLNMNFLYYLVHFIIAILNVMDYIILIKKKNIFALILIFVLKIIIN